MEDSSKEYFLNLAVVSREDTPMVPAGHEIAGGQFAMNPGAATTVCTEEFATKGTGFHLWRPKRC